MRSLLVLSLLVSLSACGRPYMPGVSVNAPQEKEKILLLDHGLTYYLKIVRQAASRTPGGQLVVKVDVENEENKDVPTDVNVIFKGEDGFELENTGWQPQLFRRREVTTLAKTSIDARATDYRILIRNVK
ncbi:MAG: hypothetical protein V1798_02975 [Pseudomonadota bacterium]